MSSPHALTCCLPELATDSKRDPKEAKLVKVSVDKRLFFQFIKSYISSRCAPTDNRSSPFCIISSGFHLSSLGILLFEFTFILAVHFVDRSQALSIYHASPAWFHTLQHRIVLLHTTTHLSHSWFLSYREITAQVRASLT